MRLTQEHLARRGGPWIGSRCPLAPAILTRPGACVSSATRWRSDAIQGEIDMTGGLEDADELAKADWKQTKPVPVGDGGVTAPERDGVGREQVRKIRCAGRRVQRCRAWRGQEVANS